MNHPLARSAKDTGSSEMQITFLTQKIQSLSQHFKKHKQDKHSRRGLMQMVAKRKKLLDYLKSKSPKIYQNTLRQLSLRK